jgi:hypothetical protein
VPLFALALEDEAPDGGPFGCCAPLPFCSLAPEEFAPVVFPVGCCGPGVVLEPEFELLPLWPPFVLLSPWLPLPAELFVDAGGGGLAGAGGTLAGPDTPASSKAANGWVLMFWLCADACAGDAEISETAAEALGILGTLGTLGLREATLVVLCLQPAGQRSDLNKNQIFQLLKFMDGGPAAASFTRWAAKFAYFPLKQGFPR